MEKLAYDLLHDTGRGIAAKNILDQILFLRIDSRLLGQLTTKAAENQITMSEYVRRSLTEVVAPIVANKMALKTKWETITSMIERTTSFRCDNIAYRVERDSVWVWSTNSAQSHFETNIAGAVKVFGYCAYYTIEDERVMLRICE